MFIFSNLLVINEQQGKIVFFLLCFSHRGSWRKKSFFCRCYVWPRFFPWRLSRVCQLVYFSHRRYSKVSIFIRYIGIRLYLLQFQSAQCLAFNFSSRRTRSVIQLCMVPLPVLQLQMVYSITHENALLFIYLLFMVRTYVINLHYLYQRLFIIYTLFICIIYIKVGYYLYVIYLHYLYKVNYYLYIIHLHYLC